MKQNEIDALLPKIKQVTTGIWEDRLESLMAQYGDVCESPIELYLAIGLNFDLPLRDDIVSACNIYWRGGYDLERGVKDMLGYRTPALAIYPQMRINDYRVDFGLLYRPKSSFVCGAVIECDGHDHHYNTKEKVSADRSRDRDLQAMGFQIMRFPGSDLFNRLQDCLDDIGNFLGAAYCADELDGKTPPNVVAEAEDGGLRILKRCVALDAEIPF